LTPPAYRAALKTGIVHFGPGAFHRAHQADYIDRLLHDDPRWGIAGVSLRSAGTVEALKGQDGLYTLAILDAEPSYRIIGAHSAFLGPDEAAAVRLALADENVRIVSSTVTEKGYCLAGDGSLDFAHADIVHDLAHPGEPHSLVGWLALGLADRRARGGAPFTTLCCDNMASNGRKLAAAVQAYSARVDPELARWIAGEARFPDTMVDSITPATTDALRARVRAETGRADAMPVSREAYSAWVIEDVLPADAPNLAAAGAIVASDVAAWERAKLRLLNGPHSSIAYLGLLLGHESVAEAMHDPDLARFVERLMIGDIAPTLEPSPIDLRAYAREVLDRFRNPAIRHLLSQIAWDGSQKLPYRLLDTIADARRAGRPVRRLAVPVAAWMVFVRRRARAGVEIVDPLAAQLVEADTPERLLAIRQIFPAALAEDETVSAAILDAARLLEARGVRECIANEEACFA
jgi:fructuronate reductase